ncbi:MAG: beta-L-arabinofuranosidase domain-containing protein, partial [Planctomycetota bacterium]
MKTQSLLCASVLSVVAIGWASSGRVPAGGDEKDVTPDSRGNRQDKPAEQAARKALPKVSLLVSVPDVKVDTVVGRLPRLPVHIPGVYRHETGGPLLRVIWPAPTDNRQVLKVGSYTLTGRVPGTPFKPRAVVTVKAAPEAAVAMQRRLEPFPLGGVVLERDSKGRDTPFIKNRDKFVSALAETDPDRFLYNFRDAFGQKQPEGVRPLQGWDSQKVRLRGHASGHYLSALAQAYAGAAYDEKLRENFFKKMEHMIDTLHTLSQLSGKPVKEGGPCTTDPAAVPKGPGKKEYDSDLSGEWIRTDTWNWGKGFISGYPPDQFIMLEKGAS